MTLNSYMRPVLGVGADLGQEGAYSWKPCAWGTPGWMPEARQIGALDRVRAQWGCWVSRGVMGCLEWRASK